MPRADMPSRSNAPQVPWDQASAPYAALLPPEELAGVRQVGHEATSEAARGRLLARALVRTSLASALGTHEADGR